MSEYRIMNRVTLLLVTILVVFKVNGQQFRFSPDGERIIERPESSTDIDKPERFSLHFQLTYIYQYKPSFTSPYQGQNSLGGNKEDVDALTSTLFMGLRLWKGAAIYANPEMTGGGGLSGAHGMAGSSNGETFLVTGTSPVVYLARGYFQQTFALRNRWSRGKGFVNIEQHESVANQLAGYSPKNYLRFYLGKMSPVDLFDKNKYSNESRRQFMNWALMNNGAWDYASDPRGYTYCFATEMQLGKMNYKVALSSVPESITSEALNLDPEKGYALTGEIARKLKIRNGEGNIRLFGYLNKAQVNTYSQATAWGINNATIPDVMNVDTNGALQQKAGLGLSFDQELSTNLGLFARVSYNEGNWGYTEIDHSLSLGIVAKGSGWNREGDHLGLALVANGISGDHQKYLALGGNGMMLGDGALNYANEFLAELYYDFKPLNQGIWFTGDYQFCLNPGYNADRGPVHIFSFRAHVAL